MLPDEILSAIKSYGREIEWATDYLEITSITGGSINQAVLVKTDTLSFFLKYNTASLHPKMFSSEFMGLELLAQTKSLRIPKPLFIHEGEQYSCILMEYIEESPYCVNFWEIFAKQLAELHQNSADYFGLHFPNYMASLPQSNVPHQNFVEFFINERLEPQIKIARNKGYLNNEHLRQLERLYKELFSIIPTEKPALTHGDLWSGNLMCDKKGMPVVMDPAVYFGHRELDIAMTTMFGGFSPLFYKTYQEIYPMEKSWEERLAFYNLYPILIHINLFGNSYLPYFERVLQRF